MTIPPTERFNSSILATIQGQLYILVVDRLSKGRKKRVGCKIIPDAVSVKSTIIYYMLASLSFEDQIVISKEES